MDKNRGIMKHEWRKHERGFYLPPAKPVVVEMPSLKYFCIEGKGNPNSDFFPLYIEALYTISYAIRMSYRKGLAPEDYFEYTVYPLEGVWDITEEAKKHFDGSINKDDLVFKLMIRQPDFVTNTFAMQMLEWVKKNKNNQLLNKLSFETITEGKCIQMLHHGSYDDEPKSFKLMEEFAIEENLIRKSKVHREIYLTDARKTAPEKLKTILRFKVHE